MGQASASSSASTGIQTSGNQTIGAQNSYTSIVVALVVIVLAFVWIKKGKI
jgi:hypothetical protein